MAELSPSPRSSWPIALVIALLVCGGVIVGIKQLQHDDGDDTPAPVAAAVKVDLKDLPVSTTKTTIKAAPHDTDQSMAPNGGVVHPRKKTALYDAPGGKPFAAITPQQFGDTWLPIIAHATGWFQVLLPSRPDGSTGWIQASKVTVAHSSYQIQVHLDERRLDLFQEGQQVGTWTVAVGADATPTPVGRTFILGQAVDIDQRFSPVIIPLGTHSNTLDSFGGGPGTVAIHGWPDDKVFGKAVSHGCVRVPADALAVLRTVPVGTAVLVTKT